MRGAGARTEENHPLNGFPVDRHGEMAPHCMPRSRPGGLQSSYGTRAMLMAEYFVLLALDPQSGRISVPYPDTHADVLCAAALIIDLIAQHRLTLDAAGRLSADTTLPCSHAELDAAASALALLPHADAWTAIRQVARRLAPLDRHLLEVLHRRDFLHRLQDWRFWRRDSVRYPLRSLQARNEAAAQLQHAADGLGGAAGIGLLMLADVAGVMTRHLDARQHERASRILLSLNDVDTSHELGGVAAIRRALLD